MRHNIVREDGKATSATVFHRGRIYVAAPDHPNFYAIIDALEQGRPPREVIDLFDVSSVIARGFRAARKLVRSVVDDFKDGFDTGTDLEKVAKDITIKGKRLYFRGEEVHGALADAVLRFQQEGNDNYLPLVRFMAKVMENPNEHSREHLYAWMRNKSFVLHEDGDLIAYKGMYRATDKADRNIGFTATTQGPGTINGKKKNLGLNAQRVGDVVELPREQVTFDPSHGCAPGLHVGTWHFASGYGKVIVEVKVNPKDVVSVPTGDSWQKMRVCRYEVLREVSEEDAKLLRRSKFATA